ncbi:MAG: hypothetical protein ACKO0M_11530, partial [Cyanobium sp.]
MPSLLAGCGQLPLPRKTRHVVVVPTDQLEWMARDYLFEGKAIDPLLEAFRRLQPDVVVQISVVKENKLASILRDSTTRGLAPDLLLLRAPQAVTLIQQGLIDPMTVADPRVRELRHLLPSVDLSRVTTPSGIAGLPIFSEFSLACYDRRRVAQPPANLSELLALAASGRPVGLSIDPIGLWWTAGALGARDVITPIIMNSPGPRGMSSRQQRQVLIRWLAWLRQAALQSRVEIESGPHELIFGLESGRLSWVPCFSPTLSRLDRTMGRHLGVAPLPSGPGGMPTPLSATRVWSLGRNSSTEQRRLALQLASISLDPLIQRQLMLVSRTILPANRFVPIPVASSGRLAALAVADRQFQQSSPLIARPFPISRLQQLQPAMEAMLMDVMVGLSTPEQGADHLLGLRQT